MSEVVRDKTIGALYEAFKKRGRKHDLKWVLYQERGGLLRCPRIPHNNWRVFSEKEIDEIVRAFSDGGKGYWHYDEN